MSDEQLSQPPAPSRRVSWPWLALVAVLVLVGGFAGYRRAGRTHIPCEVRDGDRTAALLNAVASNQSHGLKRSPEDKRLAVRLVLVAEPDWSDRRIADHVGVGHQLVSDVRGEITTPQVDDSSTCKPDQLKSDLTCERPSGLGRLYRNQVSQLAHLNLPHPPTHPTSSSAAFAKT